MTPPPLVPAVTRRQKLGRWTLRLAVGVMLAMGFALLFLLAQATNNRLLYERYYGPLFAVNVVMASLLLIVILWGVYRLVVRLRRGRFGSQLLIKLAAIFGLVGVLPGLVIYGVSYQFVSRSIESWFDVRVEGALESGVNLARASLETQARDFGNQLRAASTPLADMPDTLVPVPLERIRAQLGATDILLWTASGRLIASAGQSRFELNPDRPSVPQMRLARTQGMATSIEGIDDVPAKGHGNAASARIKALVVLNASSLGLTDEQRMLQAELPLPTGLVQNALAVQEANREYQERALGRDGLRRMYIATLTLSLFLAVFGAVLLAVVLGKQLVTPLLTIADGVRQVAAGDLTPKLVLQGRDELVGLTRSFADMTRQLAEAREAVQHSMDEVSASRANLQTMLDNLTAGVMVLDRAGVIRSSNPGATRVLRAPLAAFEGQPLGALPGLEAFACEVLNQFSQFEGERLEHGLDHWQQPFELYGKTEGANADALSMVVRGAALPDGLRLLVIDDISEIVSAQRAQAWGEVARRLAHEIKNPLTPIQLSAERLERKLAGKLPDADQAVLTKSVRTIVEQVEAMKRLVNEFRDYARLPAAQLRPLDLNALISEILHLYQGLADVPLSAAWIPVRAELDPDCPPVRGDPEQLRQVIHNLLQNAQDATESSLQAGQPVQPVVIRTQWQAQAGRVRLSVMDHGTGFSDALLKRAFEPYVTTKQKGTGLGLAVVKKIVEEHGARIDLSNRTVDGQVAGAQVSVSFDISSERSFA